MSWKEIGEALPGKDMEDIKKKYRELYVVAPANVKQKETEARKEETKKDENNKEEKKEKNEEVAKSDEAKAAEASKESGDGKKGGKEGKQAKKGQKGQKEQKGTEKAKEAKVEQAKPEEAKVEQAKPEEAKEEEAKPDTKTGILKAKATKGEKGKGGELKSINGHPVIFVDDNEELEFDEVSLRVMRSFAILANARDSYCTFMASTRATMSKSGSLWTQSSSTSLEKGSVPKS